MDKQCILIVEDDADIRKLLVFNLQKEHFATLEAADGKTGLDMAQRHRPDLILLDVMLPGLDGFEVCKALRRAPETAAVPVIILTARGEEIDRIVGLELGADDYVIKPFSVRELILRIRTILRRQVGSQDAHTLSRHGVTLDPSAHTVTVQGQPVDLTATEFRLLQDLLEHAGKVRTRENLLNSVWGYEFEGYARTVDTHVRRLRTKIGEAATIVETVRGVGYRLKE